MKLHVDEAMPKLMIQRKSKMYGKIEEACLSGEGLLNEPGYFDVGQNHHFFDGMMNLQICVGKQVKHANCPTSPASDRQMF